MSLSDIPKLPARPVHAHKGMFGHALLVGGSPGMTGAIVIAAKACLRSGAGLVTVAAAEPSIPIVAVGHPGYMTVSLPVFDDRLPNHSWTVLTQSKYSNAILGLGPGLGRGTQADAFVVQCFADWPNTAVLDADALNALADSEPWRTVRDGSMAASSKDLSLHRVPAGRILTPHPGEWSRLCGVAPQDIDGQRDSANRIAAATRSIIVLKGHRTWVTDGTRHYENATGNPSLAVGGSGDCLTGMIVAFVCQGLSPWDASVLGTYLHGLAADIAHAQLGTPSTLATDLIDYLPHAFRQHNRGS